jgi:hypothetical protein
MSATIFANSGAFRSGVTFVMCLPARGHGCAVFELRPELLRAGEVERDLDAGMGASRVG